MSFQQQNSRDMDKQGLGYGHCTAQIDDRPFSIRHYVLTSRQKNVEQSWPFPQKHLKLCLNRGIINVLPPLETPSLLADGLHGVPVMDFTLKDKESDGFGKNRRIEMDETEKILKPGKDSSLKDRISLLCGKLSQLSLSSDGLRNQSFKEQNTLHKNMSNKGRRRKWRTKKKSLAEILAVAKHCILDGHDRIYVSGGGSSTSKAQIGDEQRGRKINNVASGSDSKFPEPAQDCSLMKKHQRCDDSGTEIGQFSKRSRNTGMMNCRYNQCKLKSWSRKMNSCKASEAEKPGSYERKARETHVPISVAKLQDHHAY